jgi:hypothetical protein
VIHDHLGDVHQALGDRAKALVHWERARALERDPALGAAIGAKIDAAKQKVTSAPGDPAGAPAAR